MKLTIRIMGIATSAIWALLLLFSVSAIYSMKDVRVNLGQLQISAPESDQLLLSYPVSIVNTGFYTIANLNMSSVIFNASGSKLAQGFTTIPIVLEGHTMNATHDIRLNLTELLQTNQNLVFQDAELVTNMTVVMSAAGAIPIQVSTNISVPWGAPLYRLAVGNPVFSTYNPTYSRASVPLSFENHASFNLSGTVLLRAYDTQGASVAQVKTNLEVPQHSSYEGNVESLVSMRLTSFSHFEVSFTFQSFNYGPLVVPYGG